MKTTINPTKIKKIKELLSRKNGISNKELKEITLNYFYDDEPEERNLFKELAKGIKEIKVKSVKKVSR